MRSKKFLSVLSVMLVAIVVAVFSTSAQLASKGPGDAFFLSLRVAETRGDGNHVSGIFDVLPPPPGQALEPIKRPNRQEYGNKRAATPADANLTPTTLPFADIDTILFPGSFDTADKRAQLLEGFDLSARPHTVAEGVGPVFNTTRCVDCHLNSSKDVLPGTNLTQFDSMAGRANRSSPTNFKLATLFNAEGVRVGVPLDNPDALNNSGDTFTFTNFQDYNPELHVTDPLDGSGVPNVLNASGNPITPFNQNFGGFVQHRRAITGCLPDALPTVVEDLNLVGIEPETGLSGLGFKRAVAEFNGPPYIGRGLMEAIPTVDIINAQDPRDVRKLASSLDNPNIFACTGDCVAGRANPIARTFNPNTGTGFAGGVGRFGLRANGTELLQFVVGGTQGGMSMSSLINPTEQPFRFGANRNPNCQDPVPEPAPGSLPAPNDPKPSRFELSLATLYSTRNFMRLIAPPEFGQPLLNVLNSPNPEAPQPAGTIEAQVQRGARLFGIDLVAFANRMIPGKFPAGGDNRDPNAINRADVQVGCVACHIPIQRTGRAPALDRDFALVGQHLSFKWAPIFSDLLLHRVPSIDAERNASTPRDPLVITRLASDGVLYETLDIPRNLAQDAFQAQNPTQGRNPNRSLPGIPEGRPAFGDEFRTTPLMGMGRIGPPYLHDGRAFLSKITFNSKPAGTVYSNSQVTNAPLVVRSLDDAIRAAIELHDLPAPDDSRTPRVAGAGCPVPPPGAVLNVSYSGNPANVICPPYTSPLSTTHRSDAREVIRRYRSLSPSDQQAMIEFLKQL
jgi:CxxC motif-containing protein (DUF1111 family)